MQDLTGKVQAGQTYTLKARIKYENANGPATKQFFATMHYGGGTYTNLGQRRRRRKGQWALLQRHVHDPGRAERGHGPPLLRDPVDEHPVDGPDTHLMDFKLDDVSVIGAPPPPPPSKTIEVVGKLPGEHNPLIGHKFGADGFGFVRRRPRVHVHDQRHPGLRAEPDHRRLAVDQLRQHQPDHADLLRGPGELDGPR